MENKITQDTPEIDGAKINFKTRDVIQFIIYAVTFTFFFSQLSGKLEAQGEKIAEIQTQLKEQRTDNKTDEKERELRLKAMEVNVATLGAQVEIIKRQLNIK